MGYLNIFTESTQADILYFSFRGERKVPKERHLKGNPRFPFKKTLPNRHEVRTADFRSCLALGAYPATRMAAGADGHAYLAWGNGWPHPAIGGFPLATVG